MKTTALILLVLSGLSKPAQAQISCTTDAAPIQFNTVNSLDSGTYDAHGSITVTCSGSNGGTIGVCIEVGQSAAGVNAASQRLLASAANRRTLPLQIFQDPTLTRSWGSAAFNQAALLSRRGDGPLTTAIHLRLYVPNGGAMPGIYTAQFPMMIHYGLETGQSPACETLTNVAVRAAPAKAIAPAGSQNRGHTQPPAPNHR